MTIEADVQGMAARFGVDARLLQAIMQAEGDIIKAVQCSIPSVVTRDKALEVTARSIVHRMTEYVRAHDPDAYVDYLASKWAPINATNDPQGKNKNWPHNVRVGWLGEHE